MHSQSLPSSTPSSLNNLTINHHARGCGNLALGLHTWTLHNLLEVQAKKPLHLYLLLIQLPIPLLSTRFSKECGLITEPTTTRLRYYMSWFPFHPRLQHFYLAPRLYKMAFNTRAIKHTYLVLLTQATIEDATTQLSSVSSPGTNLRRVPLHQHFAVRV